MVNPTIDASEVEMVKLKLCNFPKFLLLFSIRIVIIISIQFVLVSNSSLPFNALGLLLSPGHFIRLVLKL
jgi:hypothetical protein